MERNALGERDGVFHRDARARAYREMRARECVADQHPVARVPVRVAYHRKLAPVGIVRDKRIA